MSLETKARLAVLASGAVWGLFWIPLRGLEAAGLHPLWVMVVYFAVPTALVAPVFALRGPAMARASTAFHAIVLTSGLALTLYAASIVYTDVIRALLLFYLMPIWSAILGRLFLGEPILRIRILAMALAAFGMLVLFGLGVGWPVPQNIGDWMGLAGGFFWALSVVLLRANPGQSALDLTAGFFLNGLILSLLAALFVAPSFMPNFTDVAPALPLLTLFVVLLVIPGTFAALWGPKHLNPVVAGLLFMTEIVVGAISAALLAGEPFGLREGIGVLLISAASLIEPLNALRHGKSAHHSPPKP